MAAEARLRKPLSQQDPMVRVFFPCAQGTELLQTFALARPSDHSFLEPKDFADLRSSAFSGIPEWDAFADHVQRCSLCGEV